MDLRKLINRLGKTSLPFDPVRVQFLSPPQGDAEGNLDLIERAKQAGKDNLPSPEQKTKDSLALDIDTYLTATIRTAKKQLEDHIQGLVAIDKFQTNEFQVNEISAITKGAINSLREGCRNGVNRLFPQRKNVADGERDLENFRRKHGLDGPAVYPDNPARIFGIIFFLFTIEVALNAYTLGSAHPDGPLGVVLEMFMISALNISIGVILGWGCWREIHHQNKIRRLFLGITGTSVLLLLICFGNLAVGHYRDAILSLSSGAQELGAVGFVQEIAMLGEAVKQSLRADPFALHDFKSYLTILVGIGLALYAAKEGYGLDDHYPEFGSKSREQDKRVSEYGNLFSLLQRELTSIDKGSTEGINSIGQTADSEWAARKSHVGTAEGLISAFSNWMEEISSLGAALYAKYREINEQNRTDPRPPCFDIEFGLPDALIEPPIYSASPTNEPAKNINELIKQCSDKINVALNKYLGVYKTIGALAPEDLTKERASTFDAEVEQIYGEINKALSSGGLDDA